MDVLDDFEKYNNPMPGGGRRNVGDVSAAQDEQTRIVNREHYLKAAFLLHFTSFIGWPDGALGNDTIEVGILGQDPFGKALDTIDGKVVQGRTIVVKRSRSVKDLKSCSVLFIARSEKSRLRQIFSELGDRPVLTVSEMEDFSRKWGVINFTTAGNRVRIEINNAAAKRAHLRVSSRLLRVAKLVDDLHQPTDRQQSLSAP